ncbi:hypothetical protein FHS15_005455 [Paenibacillus castaneae]|nr:hypothetical protein [Paenibacillus castaneae]NIK80271.1 hypothetical protein [Paenibacillus castaneae]
MSKKHFNRNELSNLTIGNEGLRQEAVDYIDWILNNAKVKERGIE